jgi:hypothetical protein
MRLIDHGPRLSKCDARAALGIQTSLPLFAYFVGANQEDRVAEVRDSTNRYEVISLRRTVERKGLQRVVGGWEFLGQPSDEEYGTLMCAADGVLLSDERAFGSMTLHAAVALRRPVIGPVCPALEELAGLGGAVGVDGPLTPERILAAFHELERRAAVSAFVDFERRHEDSCVAHALAQVYRVAGMRSWQARPTDDGRKAANDD